MPSQLMTALSNNERPLPSLRREMVRILCADIHIWCHQPGRRQLRGLAERMVGQYPASLRDMIGEDIIGNGYDSLLLQLEGRVDNLNRGKHPAKRCLDSTENVEDQGQGGKSKKACARDYYGCVSWQPSIPGGEECDGLRDKQSGLKTMFVAVDRT